MRLPSGLTDKEKNAERIRTIPKSLKLNSFKTQWVYPIALLFVWFIPFPANTQTIPVGAPVLDETFRRDQLLGKVDPAWSFTVRPVFPDSSLVRKSPDADETMKLYGPVKSNAEIVHFAKNKGSVRWLPLTWQQQYNTHHPYSLNDGAMIPARGYQTLVSGGVFARYGMLSIQFKPEYVYAENKDFQGFYKQQSDAVWAGYYSVYNYIDQPEKFGDSSYKKLFWGQSSIRITAGPVSFGLSNENLWWGPGIRNSLMMSNTAPGFKHFTINTVKPVKTFLGSFEGQFICGRLDNSGFFPPDTSRTYNGKKLYIPKRDEWRYLNGIILTWQPKWTPGLFLGLTRDFISYWNDMGHKFSDYFPVITPFTKQANYGYGESPYGNDQRLSFFMRWLWVEEQAEIYGEFFREDHAFNARDAFLEPYHTMAYMFGFRKLVPLRDKKEEAIQVNFELTQLAQVGTNPERGTGLIYLHYPDPRQGYTHLGQILGAGIGPGSNMQTFGVTWIKSLKTIGIQVERYVHNNDFQVAVIQDVRAKWVDFTTSATGTWDYGRFLFSLRLDLIRSYNYQYLYRPIVSNPPRYWDPGKDVWNYQGNLSITYRF